MGGTLSIRIIEARASPLAGGGPARNFKDRLRAELQAKAKLRLGPVTGQGEEARGGKVSDEVEGLKFEVVWEPTKGALGVPVRPEDIVLEASVLRVVSLFRLCTVDSDQRYWLAGP